MPNEREQTAYKAMMEDEQIADLYENAPTDWQIGFDNGFHEGYASAQHPPAPSLEDQLDVSYEVIRTVIINSPKHVYWGAGEPDCPRDIKAANGELHTLRCKYCDDPKFPICSGAEAQHPPAPAVDENGLLPCPFCGSQNTLVESALDDCADLRWVAYCDDCVISTAGIMEKSGAIEAWNRRSK